jgi:hypothetical protein
MTKSDKLLNALAKAVSVGGGVHSANELAFMLGVPCDPAFRKFLADSVKKGLLRRVVKGFYENTITPPEPETAIWCSGDIAQITANGVSCYAELAADSPDTVTLLV